jgi:hypothetical protein
MTITNYFRQRRKLILTIRYTGIGLTLLLIVWASHEYPSDPSYGLWALAPLVIAMAVGMILEARLRCPSCNLDFRRPMLQGVDPGALDRCPRCGADFGQPMPNRD